LTQTYDIRDLQGSRQVNLTVRANEGGLCVSVPFLDTLTLPHDLGFKSSRLFTAQQIFPQTWVPRRWREGALPSADYLPSSGVPRASDGINAL
jgi:hypothetical protein